MGNNSNPQTLNPDTMNNYHKEENIEYRTAVDYIEPLPEDPYREASIHFMRIMNLSLSYIISNKDPLAASYGVAFALSMSEVVDGKSMRDIAKNIHVSPATISNNAKSFRLLAGLPTSTLQCDLETADKYRKAITKKLHI